ncbi:MAG: biopolymer transporter Tol [Clostridiales bacterium]|jgi:Tol biopolymer transport system component|nr:biopolymer transporter Tol [Clostridiales bacterium]MDR2752515.1 biopolymer transporter Tol [Clostridiales bacterium]
MKVIPIAQRKSYSEDRGVTSVLEIYEIKSGTRRVVKEYPGLIEAPNWTKDGVSLVFNCQGRLSSFHLASGIEKEIYTGIANACNNDHVLSSDGQSIAVSHGTWEDGLSRIYTLPLAGGDPRLITPIGPSYLHGWSPDGKTLAYCAERNGQFDIYTIPAIGGTETQLTNIPGLDDGPEYSPCGNFIWFNSTRSGLMQVWRMSQDGSDPERVSISDSNDWFPHISPDSQHVAYISYSKGDVAPGMHPPNKFVEIRLMPANGGKSETLVKLFGGQGTINVNSWSPDSLRFAFVSYKLRG